MWREVPQEDACAMTKDFTGLLGAGTQSGRRLFDASTIVITIKHRTVDQAITAAADLDAPWLHRLRAKGFYMKSCLNISTDAAGHVFIQ